MLNAGWTQSGGLTAVNQKKTPPTHTNTHVQAWAQYATVRHLYWILILGSRDWNVVVVFDQGWAGRGAVTGPVSWPLTLAGHTQRRKNDELEQIGTKALGGWRERRATQQRWKNEWWTKGQNDKGEKRWNGECVCRMWRGEKKICKTLVGLKASKGVSSMSRKMQKKGREKAQEWKGEERMK